MTYGRFFYHNDVKIDNEYSYYVENVIPELTTINKTVPFIAKWGYMDGGKDSCENPYRLNTSKIFEACNFSANTFMQNGDIMEYTHSMPYYINPESMATDDYNEYQYIEKGSNSVWGGTYEELVDFFTDKNEDNFDKVFGDVSLVSKYKSKRSNRKYSRFLLGNDINKSTTLFRGVKFEITELDNGKEVKTGKYNDYRFSVIYFPVYAETDMPVRFIKNDTFKFIVGIILFPKENDGFNVFNKAYVYGKNEDLIDVNENSNIQEDDSGIYIDNGSGSNYDYNYDSGNDTAGGGSGSSTYVQESTNIVDNEEVATGTINLYQTHTVEDTSLVVTNGSVSDDTLIIQ